MSKDRNIKRLTSVTYGEIPKDSIIAKLANKRTRMQNEPLTEKEANALESLKINKMSKDRENRLFELYAQKINKTTEFYLSAGTLKNVFIYAQMELDAFESEVAKLNEHATGNRLTTNRNG